MVLFSFLKNVFKFVLWIYSWLITRWERLRAGGEGDDRRWDGCMASPTRWTWVWVNSQSWWWTGRPGVLRSMGSQRVGHDWAAELNWTELNNVLTFTVQQKDSVVHICAFFFICFVAGYWVILPVHTVGPCRSAILYIIVCICQAQPPGPSLPHSPSVLATASLFSKSVSLFLFTDKFISVVFF